MTEWKSVLDALRVRVAVFPVGTLSDQKFDTHLTTLRANSVINCTSLKSQKVDAGINWNNQFMARCIR